jgi:hypothetical protein
MNDDSMRKAAEKWISANRNKRRLWERARTGSRSDELAARQSDAAVDSALKDMAALCSWEWTALGASLGDIDDVEQVLKVLEMISSKKKLIR